MVAKPAVVKRVDLDVRQTHNLNLALSAARAGLFIHPCSSANKMPIIPNWTDPEPCDIEEAEQRFYTWERHDNKLRANVGRPPRERDFVAFGCTNDPDRVAAIWRAIPDSIPGISCGPSKLIVLDGDAKETFTAPVEGVTKPRKFVYKNGKWFAAFKGELVRMIDRGDYFQFHDAPIGNMHPLRRVKKSDLTLKLRNGAGHLAALIAEYEMNDCPLTRTQSGGLHAIYDNSGADPFKSGGFKGFNLDVLAAGRQFIMPGAWRADGARYVADPAHPDLLTYFENGLLPELSKAIVEAGRLRRMSEEGSLDLPSNVPEGFTADTKGALKRFEAYAAAVDVDESRHEAAMLLARRAGDFGISCEMAQALLQDMNEGTDEDASFFGEALGEDDLASLVERMYRVREYPIGCDYKPTWEHDRTNGDVFEAVDDETAKARAPEGDPASQTNAPKSLVEDISRLLDKAPREKRLRAYNREFAQSFIGDKTVIIQTDLPGNPQGYRVMKQDAFNQERAGDRVQVGVDKQGEPVYDAAAREWLKWTERRRYLRGIEFCPGKQLPKDRFNSWRGWNVQPSEEGSCELFKQHLREVICAGDEGAYAYLWGWMAQLFQQPMVKPGVAVALISAGKGTGKSTVGDVLRQLIGPQNSFSTARKDHLVGQFNVHLSEALLVQAEEAFWSHDIHTENVLKDLVTCSGMQYERKGFTPAPGPNYSRVLITSNSSEAVPASGDERRFAVFEVSEHRKQDISYFKALHAQLENNGYARLLHELLTTDLTDFDVRTSPQTAGLMNQKLGSLNPVREFILDWLQAGSAWLGFPDRSTKVPVNDWQTQCRASLKTRRLDSKLSDTRLGRELKSAVPVVESKTAKIEGEVKRVYAFPPLAEARSSFDQAHGVKVAWGEPESSSASSEGFVAASVEDDDPLS